MQRRDDFPFLIPEKEDFDMLDWISHNYKLRERMISQNHKIYVNWLFKCVGEETDAVEIEDAQEPTESRSVVEIDAE